MFQGLGGVFAAIINIALLAVGGNDVNAAFNCFLLSVVFLAGSVFAFLLMTRTAFYQHYTGICHNVQASGSETTPLLGSPAPKAPVSVCEVMKNIWEEELTVLCIYIVTLTCFPGLIVLVVSSGGGDWTRLYFVPVACFLVFNVGDYIGRTGASFAWVPKPGSKLGLFLSLLR